MTVNDVIITAELSKRAKRLPDYAAENRALHRLSRGLLGTPAGFYGRVVDTAQRLCGAGSAGLSVLSPEQGLFHWKALTGVYKGFVGGTTPRDFSPCGTCLDRGGPVLYDRPSRYFRYLGKVTPAINEGLVIPVFAQAEPLATIWVVAHDPARHFDMEDVRILESLAGFIGVALAQKRSEADLHSQTARLERSDAFNRAVLSTSPDCIKVLDSAGRVVFVNDPGLKLLGLRNAKNLLEKVWVEFWSGGQKRAAARALKSARKSGASKFQGCRPGANGTPQWWDVTINSLPDQEGQLLVISRDITELK